MKFHKLSINIQKSTRISCALVDITTFYDVISFRHIIAIVTLTFDLVNNTHSHTRGESYDLIVKCHNNQIRNEVVMISLEHKYSPCDLDI